MASLNGILQRPFLAAAAVTAASLYSDLTQILPRVKTSAHIPPSSPLEPSTFTFNQSFPILTRIPIHILPNVDSLKQSIPLFSFASSPLLLKAYRQAELDKSKRAPSLKKHVGIAQQEVLYKWHLPAFPSDKSKAVVVLLGWLGSKQKHLKKYAEWYTARGFHVITFTFPMSEVLSYKVGGKVEKEIELLVKHLGEWIEDEDGKTLIFHTFSNTGWLIYGAILENFDKQDCCMVKRIKGCIVDSAPVAAPDPQVWASGFSAAFLKKQSVAVKPTDPTQQTGEPKPGPTEAALLTVLEKFFSFILNLPSINRRLSDVIGHLSSGQPTCPQLYMYSTADKVIPVDAVESFIEKQKKTGAVVRSCNFEYSPHVDHFRSNPKLYTSQVSQFLDSYVLPTEK